MSDLMIEGLGWSALRKARHEKDIAAMAMDDSNEAAYLRNSVEYYEQHITDLNKLLAECEHTEGRLQQIATKIKSFQEGKC